MKSSIRIVTTTSNAMTIANLYCRPNAACCRTCSRVVYNADHSFERPWLRNASRHPALTYSAIGVLVKPGSIFITVPSLSEHGAMCDPKIELLTMWTPEIKRMESDVISVIIKWSRYSVVRSLW